MMKSKLAILIGLVALASTAHAAEIYNKDSNKLDLYGKVKAEHDFTSSVGNSDATYARLGFKGETQIANGVVGYGQFEHQFNADQAEGPAQTESTRLAFAGLDLGDYGSIDYGRNYGIQYDIGSYTDVLTEFGGDSFQNVDNYMNQRTTGVLTYRNKNFFGLVDGLALGLQYQGANEREDAPLKSNGEGFGTSLQYEIPDSGVTVGAAYSRANTTDVEYEIPGSGASYKPALGNTAEAWSVGAKYDANSLMLTTTYTETHNMTPLKPVIHDEMLPIFTDKSKAFEAIAGYTFDFGLQPTVGYVQQRAELAGHSFDAVKYVQLGAAYYFNKNFAVDAAYKINLLKDGNDFGFKTDDQTVLGATYQF